MRSRTRGFAVAVATGFGLIVHAQSVPKAPAPPITKSAVGAWDATIVRRAAKILATSAQWNKADTGDCAVGAKTFSISCALDQANQEAAGISQDTDRRVRAERSLTRSRSSRSLALRRSQRVCGART